MYCLQERLNKSCLHYTLHCLSIVLFESKVFNCSSKLPPPVSETLPIFSQIFSRNSSSFRSKFENVISTDQVKIKKYFYILRSILACMWIEKKNSMPPMEFSKLMAEQYLDDILVNEINKLLDKKTSGLEIDIEPKSQIIIDFLGSRIEHYEQYLKTVRKDKKSDYEPLNSLFRESLKEVWA